MKPGANRSNGQGTAVDLIGGPIMKNLLIFMLPILISYVFQQLYNAVDTAIVGHKRPLYCCVQSIRGRR